MHFRAKYGENKIKSHGLPHDLALEEHQTRIPFDCYMSQVTVLHQQVSHFRSGNVSRASDENNNGNYLTDDQSSWPFLRGRTRKK
jgi:glucan phosphoethanolaminetransferase (alkaline phosphatase superfamily)